MSDFGRIDVAHLVLAFVAWVWALSQVKALVREIHAGRSTDGAEVGRGWRLTTVLWMTTKASYFTFVGSVWWFDTFNIHHYEIAIYTLSGVHVVAFIHWLKLKRDEGKQVTLPPPPVTPEAYQTGETS
jgi:hypothetical protein